MRPARAGLTALLAALAAACDATPSEPAARPPLPRVAAVEIAAEQTLLVEGAQLRLSATPVTENRTPLARPVTWSSSDTTVATVTSAGWLTARAAGTATIVATSEGKAGHLSIAVLPMTVETVTVTPGQPVLEVGASLALTAEARAADGTLIRGREVRWTSFDAAALSVDSAGRITAHRAGVYLVSALVDGRAGVARVQVPPELSGTWALDVYDLVGGGTRCRLSGMRLTLEREGLAIRGTAEPGPDGIQSGCEIEGGEPPFSTPMPPVGPFAGTLAPMVAEAQFEMTLGFEYERWHLRGLYFDGSTTGTVTHVEVVDGREVRRTGRFVLQRLRG